MQRSEETLRAWLDEFTRDHAPAIDDLQVIGQDGEDGADTGLVITHLRLAATETYIQPVADDGAEWEVVFERREEDVHLSPDEVRQLIDALGTLAELCDFLGRKSVDATVPAEG